MLKQARERPKPAIALWTRERHHRVRIQRPEILAILHVGTKLSVNVIARLVTSHHDPIQAL